MQILSDIFPSFVVVLPAANPLPANELSSAPPSSGTYQLQVTRVIVTDTRILIARDSVDGPLPVFSESYAPGNFYKNPDRTKDSYITTLSGKKLAFRKDSNCGCGSRLRSWNPYNSIDSSKDPTE